MSMSKTLVLSIGTVLFLWNYDVANAIPGIPKTYKGREVHMLFTRDLPPSIVKPFIRWDNGTTEALNVQDFYPEIEEANPRGWGKVVRRLWWQYYPKMSSEDEADFLAETRRSAHIQQVNQSIKAAFQKILHDFLTLFWTERTRNEIIHRVFQRLEENEFSKTIRQGPLSYVLKGAQLSRRQSGTNFSTLKYPVPHYG